MAIYTVDNTSKIGRPCKVFDANGVELLRVIRCETETGEVEQFLTDPQTGEILIDAAKEEAVRWTKCYPAPLRVEFSG